MAGLHNARSLWKSADVSPTRALARLQRVVLTGFMAAGKTTVGRLVATRLGWEFVDADSRIEAHSGITIADFFQLHGETRFRQVEREIITGLLSSDALVLALGGGAIEDDTVRELLTQTEGTRLVYLEASLETSLIRAGAGHDLEQAADASRVRPVLADSSNLRARFERRLPLYRQSHHTVCVDHLDSEAVADEILALLREDLASR